MHSFIKFKSDLKINLLAESCYIRANAYQLWEDDSVRVKSSQQLWMRFVGDNLCKHNDGFPEVSD